nr:hypothetical protein [Tanacetum cinerariifolium]
MSSSSSSSSSHATVMYTSLSNHIRSPPWGFHLMPESDLEAPEAALRSPDQAPLLPVHALVYLAYLAPSDDDLEPAEDQPLPASISPTTLLSDYSIDSEPVNEDLQEDLEEDPSEEEEELSAPADSLPTRLYIDLPSKVEEDEVPPTPPSPTSHHHIILLSQTGLHRAWMFETGEISAAAAARQPGWIPTGKLFDFCTSKVDNEPPHGSNVDIPNIHECKQTLDKEQILDLSADTLCNVNKENLR